MSAADAYAGALVAVMVLGGLLPTRFDDREDHFALQTAAAVAGATFGAWALPLLWVAVGLAGAGLAVASAAGWRRRPWRASVGWLLLAAVQLTAGILAAALCLTPVLGRTFPVDLTGVGDLAAGVTAIAAGWLAAIGTRCAVMVAAGRPLLPWSPRAFDSALVPYLLPTMGGFPLVLAATALHDPRHPWTSLLVLGWSVPIGVASAYEVHRRELAHELRRDALAAQRLAAIGEVSARVVHQSRHQVGLMGWGIHRLRAALDEGVDPAAARRELDGLAAAKDRLTGLLASELLLEPGPVPGAAAGAGPGGGEGDVALGDLVGEVVDQLRDAARARGVEVRVELDGAAGVAVPRRLHDVVFNLVDNAVDAAVDRVAVVGTVAADGSGDDPGGVRLAVVDDGSGLADGHAERAFRPFSTTKDDGTGMGLPIAEALVADVGGRLRYERDGGATRFVVDLPRSSRSSRSAPNQ